MLSMKMGEVYEVASVHRGERILKVLGEVVEPERIWPRNKIHTNCT